jgi:hypothetical protein
VPDLVLIMLFFSQLSWVAFQRNSFLPDAKTKGTGAKSVRASSRLKQLFLF